MALKGGAWRLTSMVLLGVALGLSKEEREEASELDDLGRSIEYGRRVVRAISDGIATPFRAGSRRAEASSVRARHTLVVPAEKSSQKAPAEESHAAPTEVADPGMVDTGLATPP